MEQINEMKQMDLDQKKKKKNSDGTLRSFESYIIC